MQPIHFSATPQNVLVTGATGFIGQLLVRELLAEGHQVTVLTRQPGKASKLFEGRVSCIDTMDALSDQARIDVIVNLAGARILGWRWTPARKVVLQQSRIALTENVVSWIARATHKPKLFFSASAIGYYGIQAQSDSTALTEASPPQSIFMSQLCQNWESAAQTANRYGVQVVCMRFGLVLGRQGALPMMLLPIKMGLGGRLGTGQQSFSWIHVQDLLRAIAHVWHCAEPSAAGHAEVSVGGAYNFTAPEVVSQLQFSQIAAAALHRPCLMPTPAFPLRCLLGEQSDLLLEGQRVIPARLQTSGFSFTYPDLHSALRDLC